MEEITGRVVDELAGRLKAKLHASGLNAPSEGHVALLLRECIRESQEEDARRAAATTLAEAMAHTGTARPALDVLAPSRAAMRPRRREDAVPEYELLFGSPYDNVLTASPDGSPARRERSNWRALVDESKARQREVEEALRMARLLTQTSPSPRDHGAVRRSEAAVLLLQMQGLTADDLKCAPEVLTFRDTFTIECEWGVRIALSSHVGSAVGYALEDALVVSLLSVEQLTDPTLPSHLYDIPLTEEDVELLRRALNATLAPLTTLPASEQDIYDFGEGAEREASPSHYESYASQVGPIARAMSLGRDQSMGSAASPSRSDRHPQPTSAVYLDRRMPLLLHHTDEVEQAVTALVHFCFKLVAQR